MNAKHKYPNNKSVSARIAIVQEHVAYVGGILDTVVELGTELGSVQPRLLERLSEARQRLTVAMDALIGE